MFPATRTVRDSMTREPAIRSKKLCTKVHRGKWFQSPTSSAAEQGPQFGLAACLWKVAVVRRNATDFWRTDRLLAASDLNMRIPLGHSRSGLEQTGGVRGRICERHASAGRRRR